VTGGSPDEERLGLHHEQRSQWDALCRRHFRYIRAGVPASTGEGSAFCRQHKLDRLVYIEPHERIDEAIAREKAIKRWKRSWKLNLIGRANPDWRDLFDELNA
jgi:hypothetical protein